tara:strand:- start:8 stop:970 length:963 start_codon:yes stop_codon:yes gene_type:complete
MSALNPSVAFIICSEKGALEKKSILFAKSLRKFGGDLKDAPIYSLAPRAGRNISEDTLTSFKKLNVNHLYKPLNVKYSTYDFANKIITCTFFEKQLTEDILVFCDSDQLVLGNLNELLLDQEDLAMQHVAIKGIGTNEKDENANYWKKLYELTNVKEPRHITLSNSEQILEYYNAGLIVVKRRLGLFEKWSENFDLVMQSQIRPTKGDFFIEQSVLSATISAMELSVKVLPKGYNFHLLESSDTAETIQKMEKKEISILHYHTSFNAPKKIELAKDYENSIFSWLNSELKNCGINEHLFLTAFEMNFNLNEEQLRSLFNK